MLAPASWPESAVCSESWPELWFSEDAADQLDAQRICRTCPALTSCRNFTLDQVRQGLPLVGIWAGMTKKERDQLVA